MNSRVAPREAMPAEPARQSSVPTAAVVTPSHAADLERCRLLCETMDSFVTGAGHHYLLVAHHDVPLFRHLESPRRTVVDERDLLPPWLHAVRDPSSLFRRHVWVSTRTVPLRGWHVQQLRRIAIADAISEDQLIYCDSDVVFLKPFDCGRFRNDGKVRLFRRDNVLPTMGQEHRDWSRNAGRVLGLPAGQLSGHDYITTLIAWRRETVTAMARHIEERHGRHWIEVVASTRRFSECMLYGRYVDDALGGEGHFHDHREFCRVYWSGPRPDEETMRDFVAGLAPDQVAIGIQSFMNLEPSRIRRMLEAA